mgnify:CR=1 FL=1
MKYLILIALVLSSFCAQARRCVRDAQGRSDFQNRCLVIVQATWTPQCNAGASSPMLPVTWNWGDFIDPYTMISNREVTKSCDVELQECQDLAFRQLDRYSFTNNCGATTVGDSARYSYQQLDADGQVVSEVTGRFKK